MFSLASYWSRCKIKNCPSSAYCLWNFLFLVSSVKGAIENCSAEGGILRCSLTKMDIKTGTQFWCFLMHDLVLSIAVPQIKVKTWGNWGKPWGLCYQFQFLSNFKVNKNDVMMVLDCWRDTNWRYQMCFQLTSEFRDNHHIKKFDKSFTLSQHTAEMVMCL